MILGHSYGDVATAVVALVGVVLHATALSAADKVQIEISGVVQPYCANNGVTIPFKGLDLGKPGSANFRFTVDCNAPFQYSVQSENGALRLVNAPATAPLDAIEIPYDLHITIPLTLGGAINDTCSSASIKQGSVSCKFTDSGQKIAINQSATAEISWSRTADTLAAGDYVDRLMVFVIPRA